MGSKTIYFLGAGASKTAGLPVQAEILPLIFSIDTDNLAEEQTGTDFLSLEIDERLEKLQTYYPIFDKYRRQLGEFIVENFSTVQKKNQYRLAVEQAKKITSVEQDANRQKAIFLREAYEIAQGTRITLEDLFTIFDNVAIGREHFRLYSLSTMNELNGKLKSCIIYALIYSIAVKNADKSECYRKFAKYLFDAKQSQKQSEDLFTVITMNWDDVLERMLFSLCKEHNQTVLRTAQKVLPDLCFYNYDLHSASTHIPSVNIKARGYRNIKILKMHGSLAWLECPRCGRVFTDFSDEIAISEYGEVQCPCCEVPQNSSGEAPMLRSFIITPTFLKSLDNLSIKNIWQNASLDISEADKLVFIGYSFPDADFEMRCLLKKSVKSEARIEVVLPKGDNPEFCCTRFLGKDYNKDDANELIRKLQLPEERFKSFFGEDKVELRYDGFEGYVKQLEGTNYGKKGNE